MSDRMREAFEIWAISRGMDVAKALNHELWIDGVYLDSDTYAAFSAWEAAIAAHNPAREHPSGSTPDLAAIGANGNVVPGSEGVDDAMVNRALATYGVTDGGNKYQRERMRNALQAAMGGNTDA